MTDDKNWYSAVAAVPSAHHARAGMRCQDAVAASATPRPFVLVCDGRGSSDLSQLGSNAAAEAMPGIIRSLKPLLRRALDEDNPTSTQDWAIAGELVLRILQEHLLTIAYETETSPSQLEFTISLAVVGVRRIGVVQLGDSAILVARSGEAVQLAAPRQVGEYASETNFLGADESSVDRAEYSCLPGGNFVALLGVSDGVTAGWINAQTGAVAPGVTAVVNRLRSREWSAASLLTHLNQRIWRELPDDDRSVAAIVRALDPPEPTQCPA